VTESLRCCEASERAGEEIGATATVAENWLLVEVPGPWPRDVSEGDGLTPRARAAVQDWLARTPSSRLMFVRRPAGRASSARPLVFFVRASEAEAGVRRLELDSLDELGGLDLEHAGSASVAPLVLVCGHGTRDACCARRGTAVSTALLSHLAPDELWTSSHHGGHRFAANVLVLPAGIHLGRVSADEAPSLVGRALTGRVDLAWYRGRTVYERNVQAAERAVREATGLDGTGDVQLVAVDGDRVLFRSQRGAHEAWVETVPGPVVPASCGAEPEAQSVFTARLL
jgi:hypothetical protein